MRPLKACADVPESLTVQYGLYALDRRGRVVDAAIEVLPQGVPTPLRP